jgi:hypothetical protein
MVLARAIESELPRLQLAVLCARKSTRGGERKRRARVAVARVAASR